MPSYLVESYLADAPGAVEEARERARSFAAESTGVRYLRTTFLPGDETILHVFAAPSREALVRAAERAGLADVRVTEAIENEDDASRLRQTQGSQREER
jgi:hypothetical protein